MFALYRKGFSHVVDGIQCEIVRVELNQIDEYKANGWTDEIQDLNPEKQAEEQRQAEEARLRVEAAREAEINKQAEQHAAAYIDSLQRVAHADDPAGNGSDDVKKSDETPDETPDEQPEAAADAAPKKRGRPAKAKTEGAAE